MSDDIFGDLAEWWLHESHSREKDLPAEEVLVAALQALGIMREDELILSRRVISDWHPKTEETYESIVAIDFENVCGARTEMVVAYAIVTLPGMPIEERMRVWVERAKRLAGAGINVPIWHLAWRGTIYARYPPHNLVDYLRDYGLDDVDSTRLAESLLRTLGGLAIFPLQIGLVVSLGHRIAREAEPQRSRKLPGAQQHRGCELARTAPVHLDRPIERPAAVAFHDQRGVGARRDLGVRAEPAKHVDERRDRSRQQPRRSPEAVASRQAGRAKREEPQHRSGRAAVGRTTVGQRGQPLTQMAHVFGVGFAPDREVPRRCERADHPQPVQDRLGRGQLAPEAKGSPAAHVTKP